MTSLDRFRTAQDEPGFGFEAALAEVRSGHKRGHWIWYVFPQIQGLGQSDMARHYAIRSGAEAAAYLRDPVLGARLLTITRAVLAQFRTTNPPALTTLMGSHIDALKLVSSLTLFEEVARKLASREPDAIYGSLAADADAVLTIAASQGFPRCRHTRDLLLKEGERS